MRKINDRTAIHIALISAVLFCAQSSAEPPNEGSRARQHQKFINKVTQGQYERFKRLEPENIILIWSTVLNASAHKKEALDLLMRVINAQEEKYGYDDLHVAASYKLLADMEFSTHIDYATFAICNCLVIQQLNKGYYNDLTAASLGDFARQLLFNPSGGIVGLASFSTSCQQLNALRKLATNKTLDQHLRVAVLAEKQWSSDSGEWIDIFERDFEKPIAKLPWFRQRIARPSNPANTQKLRGLLRQNLEEFQDQICMHFGEYLKGRQNLLLTWLYINRVKRLPDSPVTGNCKSLDDAEKRIKDSLSPGQIEASPLKDSQNKQIGLILRIGDPITGHPLLDKDRKAFVLKCSVNHLELPKCKMVNERSRAYLEHFSGGSLNRAPVQLEIQTTSKDINPSYPNELIQRIENDWVPPPLSAFYPMTISFDVMQNGNVENLKIEKSSGDSYCDQSALDSIRQTYAALTSNDKTRKVHFVVRYGALASLRKVIYSGDYWIGGIPKFASLLAKLGKEIRLAYSGG